MQRVRLELTTTRVSDGHSNQLNYLCVKVKAHSTTDLRFSQTLHILYLFRILKKCTCSQLLGLRFVVQGTATPRRLFGCFLPHRFTMVAATYKRNATLPPSRSYYYFRELKYLIDACWHLRNY